MVGVQHSNLQINQNFKCSEMLKHNWLRGDTFSLDVKVYFKKGQIAVSNLCRSYVVRRTYIKGGQVLR